MGQSNLSINGFMYRKLLFVWFYASSLIFSQLFLPSVDFFLAAATLAVYLRNKTFIWT